jgi:hypothetical protein
VFGAEFTKSWSILQESIKQTWEEVICVVELESGAMTWKKPRSCGRYEPFALDHVPLATRSETADVDRDVGLLPTTVEDGERMHYNHERVAW